jgi:hypothetical protein
MLSSNRVSSRLSSDKSRSDMKCLRRDRNRLAAGAGWYPTRQHDELPRCFFDHIPWILLQSHSQIERAYLMCFSIFSWFDKVNSHTARGKHTRS